ncbi:uncharacterized protein LOC135206140 [Macrobrachium nipponense]|uniref:uncharacterized protein LOC135206140 n=1 Tax=Macrobrachium nipponense TaxID=159736 RepID=UPI0030C8CBC5
MIMVVMVVTMIVVMTMMLHQKMLLLYLLLIIILFLTQGDSAYTEKSVEITELLVPESPRDGDDVTLTCKFRIAGINHRLYTVNWWRGKDQFYTYKGSSQEPKSSFSFKGITVKNEESSNESVVLKSVSEETSGLFKCEVMGEGPTFKTAVLTKSMSVVVPPERVEIRTFAYPENALYRAGDTIDLNCTARNAKPRADLTWEINGRKVRDLDLHMYPDHYDNRHRVTSTLAIRWSAPDYFERNQATVKCIADVSGHKKTATKELYLDPASSAAFNHRYASSGHHPTARLQTWTILIFTSIFINTAYL